MPLILAMEPDRQQADLLASLCPRHIDAELVVVPSIERALRELETRVPDLLLTPLLLSTRDDAALTARVRELDDRGLPLPILVIPVLSVEEPVADQPERTGGLLTRIRRAKPAPPPRPKGCRPEVFAEQIREYLSRAAAERRDREEVMRGTSWSTPEVTATAPLLAELLPLQQPATASTLVEFEDALQSLALETRSEDRDEIVSPIVSEMAAMEPAATELAPMEPAAELAAMEPPPTEEAGPQPTLEPVIAATSEGYLAADREEEERVLTNAQESSNQHASDDDEIWMPLPVPAAQLMAPIEGPSLNRRTPRRATRLRTSKPDTRAAEPKKAARVRRARPAAKPMQDEWGLYDPEQCGFAALLERLEELTEPATAGPDGGRKR